MALTVAALVVSSTGAWAVDVKGSLVKATKTSEWTTPSPDPSGIGYNENTKRFLISDGEVDEMSIFRNINIFDADTSGELQGTAVTLPWSAEPTGIDLNPNNGEIYISDDDKRTVFVLSSLRDTSPRTIGPAKFTAHGVDPDLEGVAYDSLRNEILLANGERGAGFWRVKPGSDGQFGTGDDVVAPKILVGQHGAGDPEGIAYDAVRDTVLMVDSVSDKIYEMNENGALLNRIDLSGMGMVNAAGLEVAPASNGSKARNYYVVDRGLDNNTHPDENDGVLYEVSAQLGDPDANQPPTANAGPDLVIGSGETAALNGSATDIETPAAQLTYAWSKQAGTGTVTFGNAAAAKTTATFSASGQYTLRLTVTDPGGLSHFDDMKVTVADPGATITVTIPVNASSDDATEGSATGGTFLDTTTRQNALGTRVTGGGVSYSVLTGMRFNNVPVPKSGEIVSAHIQFTTDEVTTGNAAFTLRGQAADNPPTFAGSGNISSRPTTAASVAWAPADWNAVNDAGVAQRTSDLKPVIQALVNRAGWASGNSMVIIVSGTGRRAAKSWDAGANVAPKLVLSYKTAAAPVNKAPVVDAGADQSVQSALPATVDLKGTATDDGLPAGGTLTTTWSKVSGPGTVSFANASALATKATIGAAGVYVLRLTANDGAETVFDEVKVTVTAPAPPPPPPTNKAPVVDAGLDQTQQSTLPAGFNLKGNVSDDGLPSGSKVTSTWSKVSGPGSVSFADKTAPATKVTVDAAGTYVLRLTASDGALSASDDVTVTVTTGDAATAVTLDSDRRWVAYGSAVRFYGVASADGKAASGASVNLFVRSAGGAPELVATTTSKGDGTFTFVHRPEVNSSYFAGSGETGSNAVGVRVRPRMSAHLRHGSVLAGTRTVIAGLVAPTIAGHELRLQKWTGSRWRTVRKTVAPAADRLTFRFMVRPQRSGLHRYRVVSPPQGDRARAVAVGKQLWLRAYHATIMRVNPDADVIVVRNTGRVRFDLAGWRLVERPGGTRVALPEFVVRPGRIVRIHSGEGVDNSRNLYLGTGEMWALHGVAVLRDARLRLADRLRF